MDQHKIFFSYAKSDSDFALKLANDLRNAGANIWIDQLNILPSQRWDTEIHKALKASDCVLFIVSEASVESDNVLDEVNYALNNKKKVIPIIINNCETPYRISRLQHIVFMGNYEKGLDVVLKSLDLDNERDAEPLSRIKKENIVSYENLNDVINRQKVALELIKYEDFNSFQEGLAPVSKEGKWGFVDKTGRLVIPIQYEVTSFFQEEMVGVKKGSKWGFVDKTGRVVVPLEYDSVRNFQEGLAAVSKAGKWGFVDKTGRLVIHIQYGISLFSGFQEGLVAVKKEDRLGGFGDKWGFIDRTGRVVIPFEYDSPYMNMLCFKEGLTYIRSNLNFDR